MTQYDGVYIEGTLQNEERIFTVNTGTTSTLISSKLYDQIPTDERPCLWQRGRSRTITNVEGKPIKYYGRAAFKITLGPLKL